MNNLKRKYKRVGAFFLFPFLFNCSIPFAQCSEQITGPNVLDAGYIQANVPTKRVVQYPSLREADVIWSKRVWRTIDLR